MTPQDETGGTMRVESGYYKLITNLTKHHSKIAFPVCSSHDRITVKMLINLYQIIALDEPNQIISLNIWYKLIWTDCWFKWNPLHFDNVTNIVIPSTQVWSPDITWYEKVSQMGHAGMKTGSHSSASVWIWFNGTVMLSTQFIMRSFCRISVRLFPFDSQSCQLSFSSWLHDTSLLNLENGSDSAGMGVYVKNDEWIVVGTPVEKKRTLYCCQHTHAFSELIYTVKIKRRPLFYKFHIIFPGILLIFISCLVFVLPVESGEKVSMAVTVLLSLTVFLLLVSEMTPTTSETIPLIGQYFATIILFVSLSCAATALVLNMNAKSTGEQTMPLCVYIVFLVKLGPLVGVRRPRQHRRHKRRSRSHVTHLDDMLLDSFQDTVLHASAVMAPFHVANGARVQKRPKNMTHVCTKECNEWYALSVVLDRIFLLLFFAVSLIFCIVITVQEHVFT